MPGGERVAVLIRWRGRPAQAVDALGDDQAPEHGLRDVLDGIERERLTGSHGPAAHLHELGVLRPGLSPAKAAELLYVLTATENFEKLIEVCGWSEAEYEEWLASMLASALLARPDGEAARGR